ncbi:MAG: type I-C CRISPR-associated endonuclease Cas1 [Hyphomonas sp.]|nr:type I-C CRISPR-associated endonuclease Cas1 [Hyphomonas sp.]
MKKLLNTVYVTSEGASLRKDGENLVAQIEGEPDRRAPFHMLSSIVVFGAVYVSPALIGSCAQAGISIVLLDRAGRFQARVEGPVSGNVLLRRTQYRIAEGDAGLEIVRSIVLGKLANQRSVLMRALRDHAGDMLSPAREAIEIACRRLELLLQGSIAQATSIDILRGHEGDAGRLYFSVFDHLIRSPDDELKFQGRSRRPPLDPVNALLSFLYTLLTHDCRSALEGVGLDPAVGFLHRDRPGRPSLALDLMEELRPALADRLALALINRRQLRASDFVVSDTGAVTMRDDARKTVLTAWQERKREERLHDFIGERAPIGLTPHLQALLLARHLRGDLDGYPPLFWK